MECKLHSGNFSPVFVTTGSRYIGVGMKRFRPNHLLWSGLERAQQCSYLVKANRSPPSVVWGPPSSPLVVILSQKKLSRSSPLHRLTHHCSTCGPRVERSEHFTAEIDGPYALRSWLVDTKAWQPKPPFTQSIIHASPENVGLPRVCLTALRLIRPMPDAKPHTGSHNYSCLQEWI